MKLQTLSYTALGLIAAAGLAVAQDQPHPWRSADDPTQNQSSQAAITQADPTAQSDGGQSNAAPPAQYPQQPDSQQTAPQQYPQTAAPQYPNQPYPGQQQYPNQLPYPNQPYPQYPARQPYPAYPQYPAPAGSAPMPNTPAPTAPAHMTIKPGSFVTVRINQWLSSDKNHQGDTFSATLAEPLVVDGFVVAQRGQTVGGRVTDAQKAGRVEGTSKLGLQLTDLTLADGQTVPIQSQMFQRNGQTSVGRDAGAIAGTTALGAAIGAGVGWGTGAAIGAGAGAAAGILGVLLTRGRPTVVYPETVMTFRIDQPVDFSTEHAPQAFQYASPQDYGGPYGQGPPRYAAGGPAPAPYPYAYPPAYGYGYGYPYYPYPGFGVYVGPGFYGPRFYGRFRIR